MDFCKSTDARRAINLGKLWRAAHTGNVESVESLLEICDQNEPNQVGCESPLPRFRLSTARVTSATASVVDREVHTSELTTGPSRAPRHPQEGKTALYFASRCGHVGVVDLLLAHNADPDIKNKVGGVFVCSCAWDLIGRPLITARLIFDISPRFRRLQRGQAPLHGAARHGRYEVVHALLTAGADVQTQTNVSGYLRLSLKCCFLSAHTAILLLLFTTQGLYCPLHHAAIAGDRPVLAELLAARSVVNAQTKVSGCRRSLLSDNVVWVDCRSVSLV